MTLGTPIACSLSAGALQGRLAEMRAVGREGLVGIDRGERSLLLRFRPDADLHARIDALVEAEAACCGFLELDLSDDAGELRLAVTGPAEAASVVHEFADAFAGTGAPDEA